VLKVSSTHPAAGETVAMMHVFVLPPSESCNSRVNLLSLEEILERKKKKTSVELPVWNVGRMLSKCIDDTAKSKKACVDQTCLPLPVSGST
jgi:hypothetical protein